MAMFPARPQIQNFPAGFFRYREKKLVPVSDTKREKYKGSGLGSPYIRFPLKSVLLQPSHRIHGSRCNDIHMLVSDDQQYPDEIGSDRGPCVWADV